MTCRCVRVFTVASESRYVVVRNVPALGVIDDLLKRLSLYGKVCEYRLLDHADDREKALQFEVGVEDDDEFTDTVWVQYETVNNARHAKVRGVQKPFYGNRLQISYAPQFESREDTADKLAQRRKLLLFRARPRTHDAKRNPVAARSNKKRQTSWNPPLPPPLPPVAVNDNTEFIGPLLPSRSQQSMPELARIPSTSQHLQPRQAASAVKTQQNAKRRRI
ncbi:unnamed protein product [Peronospora farinosa]|uniref:RNA-binding protein 48 n=1 Tax=Peronospora farinosa TaxID=134698 RepID=A0AAV0T4K2_9STRA|nr:unnamed protein product [Peronospora farinosa]CAI5712552.1 unnamed protein product [Peronospora farinosa]